MAKIYTDIDISRRVEQGVLGFYTHIEITEIFFINDDDCIPRNLFSIIVAEEHIDKPISEPRYIGKHIRVKSIKGVMFGIKQSVHPISSLMQLVQNYRLDGTWQASDQPLHVGKMMPAPAQFVPADSTEDIPLNKVLKNNFWSGSHVLEMMDVDKSELLFLLDNPVRLKDLSSEITKVIPISLASLADRLGNIIIQFPVTIAVTSFLCSRTNGDKTVIVRWHPQATPRDLVAVCETTHDKIVTSYTSTVVREEETILPAEDGLGMQRGVLWDDTNKLVLSASASTAFIKSIALQSEYYDPEPRVFTVSLADGGMVEERIQLVDSHTNTIEAPKADWGEEWIKRRVYREEANRLSAQRRFVQYKPGPGQQNLSHEKAINDVVILIRNYGKRGVWLWDPYLSTDDLLRTLFRCPFKNAPLRALTAGYERPVISRPKPTFKSIFEQFCEMLKLRAGKIDRLPSFAERQRSILTTCRSNYRGLNIEFRMKIGQAGWAFHDRFLIFPDFEAGPRAWSLGTSVNSLGRQHHILQQVDDAQLVVDAFEELWNELPDPENLVWKVPS